MSRVSRRDLLRWGLLGGTALAAGPLLQACSRGRERPEAAERGIRALLQERLAGGAQAGLQLAFGAGDFLEGENRVPFGLLEPGVGRVDIEAGRAKVWVQPQGGSVGGPFDVEWRAFARPEPRPSPQGFYAAEIAFEQKGVHDLLVEVEADGRRLAGTAALQVLEKSTTLAVGERAHATLTPTVGEPRGVDPVCTRRPPCAFHKASLADALKAGKPIALQFGTPMFCESRVCGPSLEELIAVASGAGSKATFIHVEIYRDLQKSALVPAVEEWGLQSEPWFFAIDRTRVVRARIEGPQTADEIDATLEPLIT